MSLPSGNCRRYSSRQISSERVHRRLARVGREPGDTTPDPVPESREAANYRRHRPRSIFPGIASRSAFSSRFEHDLARPTTGELPCRRVSEAPASHTDGPNDQNRARRAKRPPAGGAPRALTHRHRTERARCAPPAVRALPRGPTTRATPRWTSVRSFRQASAKNQPAVRDPTPRGHGLTSRSLVHLGGRLDVDALLQLQVIPGRGLYHLPRKLRQVMFCTLTANASRLYSFHRPDVEAAMSLFRLLSDNPAAHRANFAFPGR
jgi:hypothetical protein